MASTMILKHITGVSKSLKADETAIEYFQMQIMANCRRLRGERPDPENPNDY